VSISFLPPNVPIPTPAVPTWPVAANSFTIVFLPDVHVETFSAWEWGYIYNWIVDNKTAHNIVGIVGEGDIITDAADSSLWATEYALARTGWDAFDTASIPNIAAVGNHDYDTDASVTNRLLTRFDSKFPLSRMSGQAWYGGSMDGSSSKNSYIKFDVGARKFLVLSLEIWPDDTMLTWGLGICNANLDREVIFVTHSHQNPDGTLTASTDTFGSGTKGYATNDGPGVWAKLGKLAPNMKFIVSGHQYRTPEPSTKSSYLLGMGDAGNRVHQWFCNYQTQNSGDGMIGLLRQYTTGNQVDLCAFSTLRGLPDTASILSLTWT
jgi:hypothetical protein